LIRPAALDRGRTHEAARPLHRYRRLLRYAARHRRGWLAIVGATLVSTGLGLLTPWPMKMLVDNVLDDKPLPGVVSLLPGVEASETLLIWVVAAGLFIFVAAAAADVILSFLWVRVGQAMVYEVARDLFARIQRRPLLHHRRTPVADSLARVTEDAWSVHAVVDELLFTPGHALATTVAIVAVMFHLNPTLALVALVAAPAMVVSSILLGKPIRRAGRLLREAEVDMQAHVQQTLAGMPVVQGFAQEQRHGRQFGELARTAVRSHLRGVLVGGLNNLASGLVTTVGTAVVLLVGARAVMAGDLTIGGLLVFVAYVATLHEQVGALTGIYSSLQRARASIDRVTEVLDAEPEVRDRPGARALGRVRGHVRFEDVTFAYEPGRPVLRGVSLEARPGELVAIAGATGAGKTTLASLVPRFFDPERGRVTLDGIDVRDVTLRSLRERVALVLQDSFLFPTTIAENIAYGRPGASQAEIEAAARAANAHAFVSALPAGYETLVGERGATLSGGERQRIAIARALLKDAPVLVLDEPTSALDAETEALVLEALARLVAGRTTLLIAHRLSTVSAADRIAVLAGGRIVEEGTHAQLAAGGGAYARLYGVDARAGAFQAAGAGA
jgi:ATP-binding cassette, subfamily B, bacterial